ncbi:MAG: bifunctional glutamate N-acetyltransferase/amino-acid acetyltransferase ArgJ [Chloroflexi bacterium]|nr:bifunctional glutamate N-acetyltransferase/amino-acid acetyltransferase ArgJ [Chloroflexota bacterium]
MSELTVVAEGGVTSSRGFVAGAARAGIRPDGRAPTGPRLGASLAGQAAHEGSDKPDVAILYSEAPCVATAVYTSNRLKAAPLLVTQKHLADGKARGVIANSGCANAATGEQGLRDAWEMARLAGTKLDLEPNDVVVISTGVIGTFLPVDKIASAVQAISLSAEGGGDFARAIMTTDTRPKHVAVRFDRFTVGGAAKGAGMIHPDLATMLAFLTTDAAVAPTFLAATLREAVDGSFNLIDVDSDTSTNDMVVVLANGLAGGDPIDEEHPLAGAFRSALTYVCQHLAREIVSDAEGATRLIETRVEGAASPADARRAARAVVQSLGVKTAVYGADPNWGRVLAAVGNSGCEMSADLITLWLSGPEGPDVCLYERGRPLAFDEAQARAVLHGREVRFRIDLGLGEGSATAWGSDLTEEYVRLNSLYTT